MADITETENKFLNELVKDCITYRLSKEEALDYIDFRFHRISERSYKRRKAYVLSHESSQLWLDHFTRLGFVQHHRAQMDNIQRLQDDSLRQFYIETQKSQEERNEDKIKSLKQDVRENAKLLSELGLGTPIISAIKARIEENVKTIQVRQ